MPQALVGVPRHIAVALYPSPMMPHDHVGRRPSGCCKRKDVVSEVMKRKHVILRATLRGKHRSRISTEERQGPLCTVTEWLVPTSCGSAIAQKVVFQFICYRQKVVREVISLFLSYRPKGDNEGRELDKGIPSHPMPHLHLLCLALSFSRDNRPFSEKMFLNLQLGFKYQNKYKDKDNESICIPRTGLAVCRHGQRPLRHQCVGQRTV